MQLNEQQKAELSKFIDNAHRLIVSHIVKSHISKTRIRQLNNYRAKLERLPEPLQGLTLKYLDELIEFARVFNEQGTGAAEPHADKAAETMEGISDLLERTNPYGV